MRIKNTLILIIPGFFQIKQGNILKGILIAIVFILSFSLYTASLYLQKEGSLFIFLTLAISLFYLMDVVEEWPSDGEIKIASSNSYEDARIAMLTLNYEKAEGLFLKALKEKPNDMDVTFQLGSLYYKMGNFPKSKNWLKKYCKQKKHNKWFPDAEKLLGEIANDSSYN